MGNYFLCIYYFYGFLRFIIAFDFFLVFSSPTSIFLAAAMDAFSTQ